jgi:serine/threonine-protein kinase
VKVRKTLREAELRTVSIDETADAQSDLPELSEKLRDKYEILSCIGQGGMSKLYLARQHITNELFAIKFIREELMTDASSLKLFEQEAASIKKLAHPNVVTIRDHAAPLNGTPYLIMEYVEGTSLAEMLEHYGTLDQAEVIQIFVQVCKALGHAHSKGILHCDIKPSNIIINEDKDNYVKVVDFGIARLIQAKQPLNSKSQGEELVGTLEYMSPESCQSEPVDARSEIYSMGCVMYEALCGRPPFTNKNTIKLVLEQVNQPAPNLNKAFPDLNIT